MKDAASHSATGSRSNADAIASLKKREGISFAAPIINTGAFSGEVIQAKLTEGLTYKALQEVSAYNNLTKSNQQNISKDSLVTAILHRNDKTLTQVFDRTVDKKKYTETLPDDSANFIEIGPELADFHTNKIQSRPMDFEFQDYGNNKIDDSGFTPDAISQGEIGNCWFLATLGAMTVSDYWKDYLIAQIKRIAKTNNFEVTLYEESGASNYVNITGHLLQYQTSSGFDPQLVYAQQRTVNVSNIPDENAVIWPALFEKALATIWDGYQQLDDNTPDAAFELLTGIESDLHTPRAKNLKTKAWDNLQNAFIAGAAVTLTTAKNGDLKGGTKRMAEEPDKANPLSLNLLEDHVYILTGYNGSDMILRDPHGGILAHYFSMANINTYFERIDYLEVPSDMII